MKNLLNKIIGKPNQVNLSRDQFMDMIKPYNIRWNELNDRLNEDIFPKILDSAEVAYKMATTVFLLKENDVFLSFDRAKQKEIVISSISESYSSYSK